MQQRFLTVMKQVNATLQVNGAALSVVFGGARAILPVLHMLAKEQRRSIQDQLRSMLLTFLTQEPALQQALLDAMRVKNSAIRQHAAVLLGLIGDPQMASTLLELLRHEDNASVRERLLEVLGQLGDRQAVPEIVKCLTDADAIVRIRAAGALGRLHDAQALQPLLDTLAHPDHACVRRTLIVALGQLGDPHAVEPLLKELQNPDTCIAAIQAVSRLRTTVGIPPLRTLVETPHPWPYQAEAARALATLSQETHVPVLPEATTDNDMRYATIMEFVLEQEFAADTLEILRLKWLNGATSSMIGRYLTDRDYGPLECQDYMIVAFMSPELHARVSSWWENGNDISFDRTAQPLIERAQGLWDSGHAENLVPEPNS